MIFDKLSEEVMQNQYFHELINKLLVHDTNKILKQPSKYLTITEQHHLFRFADILSNSNLDKHKNLSFKIVSSIISSTNKIEPADEIYTNAILGKLGNFPAIKLLDLKYPLPWDRSLELQVKQSRQTIPYKTEQYFTDTQFDIISSIDNKKYYSFSGPTSLGKSYVIKTLLLKEIMETKKETFIILVPTKALINQYIKDLKNDFFNLFTEFNVGVFSNFNIDFNYDNYSKKVYILTPERLLDMVSDTKESFIDVLYVDEAHKIASQNDSRSITLYLSIEKTIMHSKNLSLFFSSPLIDNPEKLLNLFNLDDSNHFYVSNQSPVSQKIIYVDLMSRNVSTLEYLNDQLLTLPLKNNSLTDIFSVIYTIGSEFSNLIYLPSIDKTITNALGLREYLLKKQKSKPQISDSISDLMKFIAENIHPNCYLIHCLEYRIGYHFGALPQTIRYKIEELFKSGDIKYLFCTSTLLEGVNLPAKNIFILDNKNGLSKMTDIDFWNLAGRAGRMNYDISGQIICVKANNTVWKNSDVLTNKNISLKPVIESKINNNTLKIKSAIEKKRKNKNNSSEEQILKYIANIISIDYLNDTHSILINKINSNSKLNLSDSLSNIQKNIIVPYDILSKSYNIDYEQQNSAFKYLLTSNVKITLSKVTYGNCLKFLNLLHEIYLWEDYEKDLSKKSVLKYYATLMNQWMNGVSIRNIIRDNIIYKNDQKKEVYKFGKSTGEVYDKNNSEHINLIIREVLDDIENIIQHKLLVYVNNYFDLNHHIYDGNVSENWSQFLEYGTIDTKEIVLQSLGLSRQSAIYFKEHYQDCIHLLINNEIEIDYILLKERIQSEEPNIYSEEIARILI
ncbi:DEAD/DEAH box helicase [Exiguobacterium sp. s143]|uniref:DEAD/DEAH box helicase n=1 Tax=Exiguobacterium sp. s143 TaxID=2751201 RepID=UPI001BE76161|nr:DEAD/DEAH box helicase [Exiguobacterium sp. s143]